MPKMFSNMSARSTAVFTVITPIDLSPFANSDVTAFAAPPKWPLVGKSVQLTGSLHRSTASV